MFLPTALPLFISDLATKRRRSAGLKKAIRIAPVMTLRTLELSLCLIHCAVIRGSRNLSEKFLRRRTDRRRESEEILRGTEAAQCLQGSGRLRGHRLVVGPDRDPSLSIF